MSSLPIRMLQRCRSRYLTAVAVAAVSVATVPALAPPPASATVVTFPGCLAYDFEDAILQKYQAVGGPAGQLGCPYGSRHPSADGIGVSQYFVNGSIYWKKGVAGAQPFVVLDPIRRRWGLMGWQTSFLGYPTMDTWPIFGPNSELGIFNHFEGGTILSSSAGTFEVHGFIRDKFLELGVQRVGFPTSDEMDFADGGRVSTFTRGSIYWWPDTGAIFVPGDTVIVNYSGLMCNEEMDWDQSSNSDEPYAIIGTVAATGGTTVRSSVYSDVDGGEGRRETIQLYRGKPQDLALLIQLMENDFGDPDHYKGLVTAAVAAAVLATQSQLPQGSPSLTKAIPILSDYINRQLDTDDDEIGTSIRSLRAKDMIVLTARPFSQHRGVDYSFTTLSFTGGGSDYQVGFIVRAAG